MVEKNDVARVATLRRDRRSGKPGGKILICCRLEDDIVTVFVVHVGHRREVYT